MADMMAVVSKAVFDKMAKSARLGDVLPLDRYTSANPLLGVLDEDGSRLFLFTVRPPDDQLWLVGVLGDLSFDGEAWIGAKNTTPITDLGGVKERIEFKSGVGIHAKPGALGMSLQTPRGLTEEDVALLLGAAGVSAPAAASPKQPPVWRRITPEMTPVQQQQLAALQQEIGTEDVNLIEWYAIDDGGKHVYDAAIFVGDDGFVFRTGTTDVVASWSQGGMAELMDDDESLEERLEAGFENRASGLGPPASGAAKPAKPPPKKAAKPAKKPAKKPAAKKAAAKPAKAAKKPAKKPKKAKR